MKKIPIESTWAEFWKVWFMPPPAPRKEGLFLAVIAEGPVGLDADQIDFEPHALIAFLLARWDERGQTPVSRALASPALSDDVRRPAGRATSRTARRLALGVAVTRANGTLAGLAKIPRDEVIAALDPIVDAIASTRG